MADKIKAAEYVSEIRQVKTMADHTYNITLNLPEYCAEQAAWFLKNQGNQIKSVSVLQSLTNGQDRHAKKTNSRATRNPLGVDSG